MIVVDSSVWIANLRDDDTEAVRKLRSITWPQEIIVGDLVLLEVLQGVRNELHSGQIERDLRQFRVEPMLNVRLAVRAAANYRELRRQGATVRKTTDLIIGTFCLECNHSLLHQDRDYKPMVTYLGLKLA